MYFKKFLSIKKINMHRIIKMNYSDNVKNILLNLYNPNANEDQLNLEEPSNKVNPNSQLAVSFEINFLNTNPIFNKLCFIMDNNMIYTKETFRDMPKCKELIFERGRFEDGVLDDLEFVEDISFIEHIDPLPTNLISKLYNLTKIKLIECDTPKGFFNKLYSLKHIRLHQNNDLEDKDIFCDLMNLKELYLSCDIKVNTKMIGHLINLESLQMNLHLRYEVDFRRFPYLSSLELILDKNIRIAPENLFHGLENLEKLFLVFYSNNNKRLLINNSLISCLKKS